MHGITQHTYDAYRDTKALRDRQTVQAITDGEVAEIYFSEYWQPSHADELPWPLSLFHFDFFVNTTPARAIATMQRTLNRVSSVTLVVDGKWGPATSGAVLLGFPTIAWRTYLIERVAEYDDIAKSNPLKRGFFVAAWIPRVIDLYRRFT